MKSVYLSVIIPSYNEKENLQRGVLSQVQRYLKKKDFAWEVIISDDDSPDLRSRQLARDFCEENTGFVYLQNKHGGKPLALWGGILKAQGKYCLFTDMDQSTPIQEIDKLLPEFGKGFDIAIGSRGVERKNFSFFRRLASVIFREVRRSLLLTELIDTQAGFKCLKTPIAKEIFPLLNVVKNCGQDAKGWTVTAWDVEMLEAAKERGYKISEVPVVWEDLDESKAKAKERQQGKFVKESVDMFVEVLRVKWNQIRGIYKK